MVVLNCLVESGTEVSEYLEAFIQLHGFFVFTEKIYKGMSLDLQLPFPEFQLGQLFHSKLEEVFHLLTQLLVPLDVFPQRFRSDKE